MKIHSSSAAAAAATPARDSERAGPSRRTEPVAPTTAPEATTVELSSSSPGRGPQSGPPGLERVLARLKTMDEGTLSPGQARAMERIERNLARYLENQGLATAPAPAPAPAPEATPVAEPELPVSAAPTPEPVVDTVPEPVVTAPVVDGDAALVEALLGDPAPTV